MLVKSNFSILNRQKLYEKFHLLSVIFKGALNPLFCPISQKK
jgi:hypothetical protein